MAVHVAVIACVRNEADIIESFVRHALSFADRVMIADHGSIDATPDIIRALAEEGLPVGMRAAGDDAQEQAVTLNGMMAELDAGWTVPLDADEFLLAPGSDVRSVLDTLAPDAAALVRMRHYLPGGTRRLAFDGFPATKVAAVPRALAKRGILTQGNHGLLIGTDAFMRSVPGLVIGHLPFRSPLQAQSKALGWLSHLLRADAKECEAFNWKELFGALMEGRLETDDDIVAWAQKYAAYVDPRHTAGTVEDPLPTTECRYAKLAARVPPCRILKGIAARLGMHPEPSDSLADVALAAEDRARWLKEARKHIDRAAASS